MSGIGEATCHRSEQVQDSHVHTTRKVNLFYLSQRVFPELLVAPSAENVGSVVRESKIRGELLFVNSMARSMSFCSRTKSKNEQRQNKSVRVKGDVFAF